MLVDFKLLQGASDLHVYLGCEPDTATWLLQASDDELFSRHLIPKKGRHGGIREVWEVRSEAISDLYKGLARKLRASGYASIADAVGAAN